MHPSRVMPSVTGRAVTSDGDRAVHPTLAGLRPMGVDPDRPRPRRALGPLRARRRPLRGGGHRRPCLRPPWQRRERRPAWRHRPVEPLPRRPRGALGCRARDSRRSPGDRLRPLDGRSDRRGLPALGPTPAGCDRPVGTGTRLDAGRLEEGPRPTARQDRADVVRAQRRPAGDAVARPRGRPAAGGGPAQLPHQHRPVRRGGARRAGAGACRRPAASAARR